MSSKVDILRTSDFPSSTEIEYDPSFTGNVGWGHECGLCEVNFTKVIERLWLTTGNQMNVVFFSQPGSCPVVAV